PETTQASGRPDHADRRATRRKPGGSPGDRPTSPALRPPDRGGGRRHHHRRLAVRSGPNPPHSRSRPTGRRHHRGNATPPPSPHPPQPAGIPPLSLQLPRQPHRLQNPVWRGGGQPVGAVGVAGPPARPDDDRGARRAAPPAGPPRPPPRSAPR